MGRYSSMQRATRATIGKQTIRYRSQAKTIEELKDQINELQQQMEQTPTANRIMDSSKRRFSKKPVVRMADDESESEEVEQALEAEDSSEISSDGSHISDMAQAVQTKNKRFPKRR